MFELRSCMARPKKDAYHHGNLKEAMVNTAINMISEEGISALSLRKLAKEVGVSATAAYNHFEDKDALLVAIKSEAFDRFHLYITTYCPGSDDPEEHLRCLARAYLSFGVEFPDVYWLMTNIKVNPERFTAEDAESAVRSEKYLHETVQKIILKNGGEPCEFNTSLGSLVCWSFVHGLTQLVLSGTISAAVNCNDWPSEFSLDSEGKRAEILESALDFMMAGIINHLSK